MPAQRFARVFCNTNWLPQANTAPPKITADGLLESSYRRLSNLLVGSSLWSCLIDKYRQIGEIRSVGATWSGRPIFRTKYFKYNTRCLFEQAGSRTRI